MCVILSGYRGRWDGTPDKRQCGPVVPGGGRREEHSTWTRRPSDLMTDMGKGPDSVGEGGLSRV